MSHDVDGTDVDVPVLVKKGEAGTTTLEENIEALAVERYSVEKYLIADPADVDGDCIDDITELDDLGSQNPVNRAASVDVINGTVAIPDRETFELLSYKGVDVLIDLHLADLEFVKFFLFHMDTDQPAVYFMNTVTHRAHLYFAWAVDILLLHAMRGEIVYHPNVTAPDGSLGVYRFEFEPNDGYPFEVVQYADGSLAYYPMPLRALPLYNTEKTQYDDGSILLEEDVFPISPSCPSRNRVRIPSDVPILATSYESLPKPVPGRRNHHHRAPNAWSAPSAGRANRPSPASTTTSHTRLREGETFDSIEGLA